MPSREPRVTVAGFAIAHHATRSGYAQLARHLAATSDRVELVEPRPLPRWLSPAATQRLVTGPRPRWYSRHTLSLELAAAQRVLTRATDVVHLLYGDDSLRHAGRLPAARLLGTFHQPPAILDAVGPGRHRLRRLRAAIALGSEQADHLAAVLGAARVFHVPHGVDTTFWTPGPAPRADATCLVVGHWLRDVAVLRAVAARLAEQAPDVRLRIAGASAEAGDALGGAPHVTLLPRLTDEELRDEYRRASLFLLPLADATANCAMLEAMACGTPIVVTDVGGTRDYVDDTSAVLTPRRDADAMTAAILDLLADDARRTALSTQARARARELDWRRIAPLVADVQRAVAANVREGGL